MKTVWTNTAARVITIFTVDQDKDMMYCTFIMAAITYLNFVYSKRQLVRGQTSFSEKCPVATPHGYFNQLILITSTCLYSQINS